MGGSGHPFTPLIHISGYAHDLGPNFPECGGDGNGRERPPLHAPNPYFWIRP